MVERSPKILASEQKSHHTTLPCYFVVTKRSTTCSLPRGSNQGKTKFINSQVKAVWFTRQPQSRFEETRCLTSTETMKLIRDGEVGGSGAGGGG